MTPEEILANILVMKKQVSSSTISSVTSTVHWTRHSVAAADVVDRT